VHDDGAEYTVDWDDDDTKLRRQPREVRPKRLVIGSPWLQFASECQRFGHPPRLNGSPFGTQHLRPLLDECDAALRRSYTGPRGPDTALQLRSRRLKCAGREGGREGGPKIVNRHGGVAGLTGWNRILRWAVAAVVLSEAVGDAVCCARLAGAWRSCGWPGRCCRRWLVRRPLRPFWRPS
jgi:hypothetical protein